MHGGGEQLLVCVRLPHGRPVPTGCTLICLVRVCSPGFPQVDEQCDQSLQADVWQSTKQTYDGTELRRKRMLSKAREIGGLHLDTIEYCTHGFVIMISVEGRMNHKEWDEANVLAADYRCHTYACKTTR